MLTFCEQASTAGDVVLLRYNSLLHSVFQFTCYVLQSDVDRKACIMINGNRNTAVVIIAADTASGCNVVNSQTITVICELKL